MNKEQLGEAIREYVREHHYIAENEVVTDYVVIAGWVDPSKEEDADDADGVHIITSQRSPGYTGRGLLATACSVWDVPAKATE